MNTAPSQIADDVLARLRERGVQPAVLCADSRNVQAGDVFVAYPGHRSDGRRHIPDALRAGAGAVLWERDGFEWNDEWIAPNLPVDGLQLLSGHLAHLVYGRPSEHLELIGVTGTNGKTSVSQWIAQALEGRGCRCGVIGTLGNGFPRELVESPNTTPDAIAMHALLARFVAAGAAVCAMEVSSIGLDQGRTNGARFAVAVFTNLTRDHLDYHGTMDAYAAAKARMFDLSGLRAAVINLDDEFGCAQALRLRQRGDRVIGYSLRDGSFEAACSQLLRAGSITDTGAGVRFDLQTGAGSVAVRAGLIGSFNVSNLLAVIGALLAVDVPLAEAAELVTHLVPPPGRMQKVGGTNEPLVVVDYAHSPDALEKVLLALRPTAGVRGGRIVCVFGCGGDRDAGKRPIMGETAHRCADAVVLTSDNPRGEDPHAIIDQVRAGAGPDATVIVDRADAIRATVIGADARDIVVLAGKGHETYQEIRGTRFPFSDAAHAASALIDRRSAPGGRP